MRRFIRLTRIVLVMARYQLDDAILAWQNFIFLRVLRLLNPWRWLSRNTRTEGERIRLAFEELGPIFVKFGQALSTRRDVLPDEVAQSLNKLVDNVPSFAPAQAQALIEQALGGSVDDYFKVFDKQPLASASIAQVHAAELHDGRDVIVKVLRPNIERIIRRDIRLMYSLAKFATRFWSEGRRLRLVELVAEFERTILDELDLMREAASASQLRRNFDNSPLLYVPEIYWPYTRPSVLVMERIYGIPITNIQVLKEHHVDMKRLAEKGVEIFFTQVFRDCFFHADMHPGNIFVSIKNPVDPQYLAVDFGIMGTLSTTDQRYLAENFLAFFKRDYRRVAELHIESGWVPYTTRVDEFESAIRTVSEPIFERPLKDISFAQLLLRLFQTARRFNMVIQPQLMLLQKTLLAVEGLGRQLYPELDLWQTAMPFLEKWMKQHLGVFATLKRIKNQAPVWGEKLPEMPDLVYSALTWVQQEATARRQKKQDEAHQEAKKCQTKRRAFRRGVGVTSLVTAVSMYALFTQVTFGVMLLPWLALILAGVGIVQLLRN